MTAAALTPFLELRRAISADRLGDGGLDVVDALTAQLDACLCELADRLPADAAVVALGGYGRGEQCINSDIDVMLLHRLSDPQVLVRKVIYPLWDVGLKVGHAVRTIEENRAEAQEDLETLTSLLSARLVIGDEELYADLVSTIVGLVETRPLAPRLAARERARRARDPYPKMAADLKEGRGGLRTHQGFWWERRRSELLNITPDSPQPDELAARSRLLAIRNALHAVSGKAMDRFVVDLREPAAAWLGSDVMAVAGDLTAALARGDRLADQRWPDIHAEQDPLTGLGRRVFGAFRSRFSSGPPRPGAEQGVLPLAVVAAARPAGAHFRSDEEHLVRGATSKEWSASDRTAFVTLLSGGERARTIFGRLEQLGWVETEFPEWIPVATAPQLAPFHDHPVGADLWRAADEMQALITGGGETGEIADEVGSTEELLLAAFLHDIGKGRGGNHAEVGAAIAAGFLRRAGFGPATVGVVVDAVRLHLLLSDTATRRDIADLGVVDEVAAEIGDLRRLRVLYLLTIADLRATGTTMWNEWRATLLRTLYHRVYEAMEVGAAPPATLNVEAVVEAAGGTFDRREIEEHVAAMPGDYLETTTPGDILWHLDVSARLEDGAVISVHPADHDRVLVVGEDRLGFLLAVSRAFVANGIGILDARLRTRDDGIALDTFHVREDTSGQPIEATRWDAVRRDLVASLSGSRDLRPAMQKRVSAYRSEREVPEAQLRTEVAGSYTAIEVRLPDRIGLFADVVEAMHGEGLDIHFAKLDTMGGVARDTFLVRQVGGSPIRTEPELEALRGRIRDRLRG